LNKEKENPTKKEGSWEGKQAPPQFTITVKKKTVKSNQAKGEKETNSKKGGGDLY